MTTTIQDKAHKAAKAVIRAVAEGCDLEFGVYSYERVVGLVQLQIDAALRDHAQGVENEYQQAQQYIRGVEEQRDRLRSAIQLVLAQQYDATPGIPAGESLQQLAAEWRVVEEGMKQQC